MVAERKPNPSAVLRDAVVRDIEASAPRALAALCCPEMKQAGAARPGGTLKTRLLASLAFTFTAGLALNLLTLPAVAQTALGGGAGGQSASGNGGAGGSSDGGGAGGGAGMSAGTAGSTSVGGTGGGGSLGGAGGIAGDSLNSGTVTSNVTGENGTAGGQGGTYGGGGGGGGAGLIATGASNLTLGTGALPGVQIHAGSGGNGGGGSSGQAGGGGGGAGIIFSGGTLTILTDTAIDGGNGGQGGGLGGGAGGGGGIGLLFQGTSLTIDSTTAVKGGVGGGSNVSGGDGGVGLVIDISGATVNGASLLQGGNANNGASTGGGVGGNGVLIIGNNNTFTSTGTIEAGASASSTYAIGLEVTGTGNLVVNAGTIYAGNNNGNIGNGAIAVELNGDNNTLQLQAGTSFAINGKVIANGSGNILALGGSSAGTFDVSSIVAAVNNGNANTEYQGFSSYDKTGSSTWTLTGTTSVVTPWTITQGTLAISADGNLGAASGTLTLDGGTLEATTNSFASSRNVTITSSGGTIDTNGVSLRLDGVIGGSGGLTKTGSGTLVLTGANTYSGATAISTGTLALSGAGTISASSGVAVDATLDISGVTSGNSTIQNLSGGASGSVLLGGTTLTVSNTSAQTFQGVISGSGGLTLQAGTETLTGTNTYTGVTTIASGATLQIGNGGTTGSIIGSGISDNGALHFDRSDSVSYAGVISGSGSLTQSGSGTLVLTGANTYSGPTTISAGTLALSGAGTISASSGVAVDATLDISGVTSGNSTIQNLSGGASGSVLLGGTTLTVSNTSAQTFQGVISGSGALALQAGTETLTGTNTYTGATTIGAGTLVLSGAGTISASSSVTVNGALDISQATTSETINNFSGGAGGSVVLGSNTLTVSNSSAQTFQGVISGSGGLTLQAGTETLTGANTYTGATTIGASASLQLGDGTTAGSINSANVSNSGTLIFDEPSSATATTFAGVISGSGDVIQQGAGSTVVLTGNNTYIGTTTISAGTLVINGNQSGATGAVTVGNGGVLAGSGTIGGGVTVGNGGALNVQDTASTGLSKLTIDQTLTVQSGGALNYTYGVSPNGNHDLLMMQVVGNVTLASGATVNVTNNSGTNFDAGVYGLIQSTGGTISGTPTLGTNPGSGSSLQNQGNRLNLVYTGGQSLNFWDGSAPGNQNNGKVDGGSGTWTAATSDMSWTTQTGGVNGAWANGQVAIFETTGGTVNVDPSSSIVVGGMQFAVTGYTLTGGTISLGTSGQTMIDVGDHTSAGAGYTATISSVLAGNAGLDKTDLGTLVLTGANSYSGGTLIEAGVLSVSADGNLGATSGALSLQTGGTLEATGTFASNRTVTLGSGGGTFDTDSGSSLTLNGAISGSGALTKAGAGTLVLTGSNTYSGGTIINAGVLSVSSDGNLGAASGGLTFNGGTLENTATVISGRAVTLNTGGGTLQTDADLTLNGVISGSGALTKTGGGTLILTGANTYSGATTISTGILQIGDGGTTGTLGSGPVTDNAALVFDRSDAVLFGGAISGSGSLAQNGSGTLVLTADNAYTGATNVNAGTLAVDGDQSGATGPLTVNSGATLTGHGVIGGAVNVENGGALTVQNVIPGSRQLAINGALSFASSAATLNYNYGASPSSNPDALLLDVGGAVTLNGVTVNVTSAGGQFAPGVYGLIHSNTGLSGTATAGTLPSAYFSLQQVGSDLDLVNTAGMTFNYWNGNGPPQTTNGVPNGGSGTWTASPSARNWTNADASSDGPWTSSAFAIFGTQGGTVTVDMSGGPIAVGGMQFTADGYTITGGTLTLVPSGIYALNPFGGEVFITVGTGANGPFTATIASVLAGDGELIKSGAGTLVLTGTNTYTGGTLIQGGVLQVSSDSNLGASAGLLGFDGGTLEATQSFASARTLTIDSGGGTIQTDPSVNLALTGPIGGSGSLIKTGAGTLTLSGTNSYSGGTFIDAGILAVSVDANLGAATGGLTFQGGALEATGSFATARTVTLASDATVITDANAALTFNGAVGGAGALTKAGAGTLILAAADTYAGGTTISAGTLQIGNGGTTGSIQGNVTDNATLAFDRSDVFTFSNVISGTGNVVQLGTGTTILTADSPYTGTTTVVRGTLALDPTYLTGTSLVTIDAGATFGGYGGVSGSVTNAGTLAVANAISALSSLGNGTFAIGGTLTNNGLVQIGGGNTIGNTLTVGSYVGGNGSVVAINTQLGGSNSPSDKLVINGGTATGSSVMRISNIGGQGALTTGNGILVVNAINGATTAPGAFTASGLLEAGPYQYTLNRGGVGGSDPNDWYLRSTVDCAAAPTLCSSNNPPPNPGNNQTAPNYRPEVSLYAALPTMALSYGLSLIETFHERVGEDTYMDPSNGGAWARFVGEHQSRSGGSLGVYGGLGPSYNAEIYAFQGGLDLYRHVNGDGSRDHAGLYAAAGQISGAVTNFAGLTVGRNSLQGYSVGGYWTHFGPTGWYLDAVAQGTWYDVTAASNEMMALKTSGASFAASLEGGYPFHVWDHWIIEPQAQLVYQHLALNNSGDAVSSVYFPSANSLPGRLGVELRKSWDLGANPFLPRIVTTWLRGDVWHDFVGDPTVSFPSANGLLPFSSDLRQTWVDLRVGATAQVTSNAAFFASAGYDVGINHQNYGYNGKIGLNIVW